MRAAVCREHGPPEVVRVEEVPAPPLEAGQVRVRVHAAAVNFPDVLLVANEYQIKVPTPFVPGSEFAGVVAEVADDVDDLAVGDRVCGTGFVGAFAEEAVVSGRGAARSSPPGRGRPPRRRLRRGAPHRLPRAPVGRRAADRETSSSCSAPAAASGWPRCSSAPLLGASVTAVASSAREARRRGGERRRATSSTIVPATCGKRSGKLLPDGADVVVDPVGGDLSEPALRALRWGGRFVTVGYASGVIPRIPLNLVLLKGVARPGVPDAWTSPRTRPTTPAATSRS